MIKFTSNTYEFYLLKATFTDNGEPRTEYGDARFYWENLVSKWGHLNNLHIEQVQPTEDQAARLAVLNGLEAEHKSIHPAECSRFVEHGVIVEDEDGCPFLQPLAEAYKGSTLDYFRELKRQSLKEERESRTVAPINNVQVEKESDRERVEGAIRNWELLEKNPDGTKTWVMADNSIYPLSKADMQAVVDGYAVRLDQCFIAYGIAVHQLEQAQTVEEILAVELPETAQ